MSNALVTLSRPLAITREGQPFDPVDAAQWSLQRHSGGRPQMVCVPGTKDAVLLDIKANKSDLRRAVANRPGVYILTAVNEYGEELGYPPAEIELAPMDAGPWSTPTADIPSRMFEMMATMVEGFKSSQLVLVDATRAMAQSMVQQHSAGAALLQAANSTIGVANGVDALTRQLPSPKIDVEELAEQLGITLGDGDQDDGKPEESGFKKFLESPLCAMVLGIVNGFGQPWIQLHQARMQAEIEAVQREAAAAEADDAGDDDDDAGELEDLEAEGTEDAGESEIMNEE